jgi:hypothetical protein
MVRRARTAFWTTFYSHLMSQPDETPFPRRSSCTFAGSASRCGSADNSSDPYFMQIRDDLADKGFFTATAEELITWARTGSLMWMTSGWLAALSR